MDAQRAPVIVVAAQTGVDGELAPGELGAQVVDGEEGEQGGEGEEDVADPAQDAAPGDEAPQAPGPLAQVVQVDALGARPRGGLGLWVFGGHSAKLPRTPTQSVCTRPLSSTRA